MPLLPAIVLVFSASASGPATPHAPLFSAHEPAVGESAMSADTSAHIQALRNENRQRHRVRPVLGVSAAEADFFEIYFPFMVDGNLHPALKDRVVAIWVLTAIFGGCLGPLWIPSLFGGLETDDDYFNEALANWAIHVGISLLGTMTSSFGIGLLLIGANQFWLFPVATINSINRHMKKSRPRDRGDRGRPIERVPPVEPMGHLGHLSTVAF